MDLVEFLNKFNWQTIVGMVVISWYFTHDLKMSIEKQSARTDRLYEMFIDLLKEKK